MEHCGWNGGGVEQVVFFFQTVEITAGQLFRHGRNVHGALESGTRHSRSERSRGTQPACCDCYYFILFFFVFFYHCELQSLPHQKSECVARQNSWFRFCRSCRRGSEPHRWLFSELLYETRGVFGLAPFPRGKNQNFKVVVLDKFPPPVLPCYYHCHIVPSAKYRNFFFSVEKRDTSSGLFH